MKIIDADGAVLGRLAADAAKRLLNGEELVIVNAEKAIITGSKKMIFEKYRERVDRGHRYKGPFFPKAPHMLVKRTIRGMLPWKSPRGREAFKRLKVHISVPEELEGREFEKGPQLKGAPKFMRVEELSRKLGWNA